MKTLVLSDLHIGPDTAAPIYAGDGAVPALIRSHLPALRVILNGDVFDFLLDGDPLELRMDTAVARLKACAGSRDGAPLLDALVDVQKAGGEVLIRAGNHDLELALPEVQRALIEMLVARGGRADRISFATHDEPTIVTVGPHRVLVTHGEHADPFNRWQRASLLEAATTHPEEFRYPAGSKLVKDILNPLKARMRFLDLLKPDFHGAIMAALAVDPSATKQLLDRSTLDIISSAAESAAQGQNFDPGAQGQNFDPGVDPFARYIAAAELDMDEAGELADGLDPESAFAFGVSTLLHRALDKIGRAAMWAYAAMQRRIAARAGEDFFDEFPAEAEWAEAKRLALKYDTNIVVTGHTHARRQRHDDGLSYFNTGTWIALLELPPSDAPVSDWAEFLRELRTDPMLATSERVRVVETGCFIDPSEPVPARAARLVGQTRRYRVRAAAQ